MQIEECRIRFLQKSTLSYLFITLLINQQKQNTITYTLTKLLLIIDLSKI